MKAFIAAVMIAATAAFGQDAPKDICLTPREQVVLAQKLVSKDTEIASLKKDAGVPVELVIALVAAGVLLGAGTTVAVYELGKTK